MAVERQVVTEKYAWYLGDTCELLPSLPSESIHMSCYSPPFAGLAGGLYRYTSSERDLSNCRDYGEFFEHYGFVVREIARLTLPGRSSLVHCMDVPKSNTGRGDGLMDFPGDIIRLHEEHGFDYRGRYHIWKEPLTVRNRTMTKGLAHKTIVEDSSRCSVASADYMLRFAKRGENPIPISHLQGLMDYAGWREVPPELYKWRGWQGNQIENRFSHWIWRQYASSFWDDVRLDRVLPFKEAREEEDERHIHPLQLDAIQRSLVLWSNPGETVLTPFGGVGSEVYEAVVSDRLGIGCEIKPSYYRQGCKHLAVAERGGYDEAEMTTLDMEPEPEEAEAYEIEATG